MIFLFRRLILCLFLSVSFPSAEFTGIWKTEQRVMVASVPQRRSTALLSWSISLLRWAFTLLLFSFWWLSLVLNVCSYFLFSLLCLRDILLSSCNSLASTNTKRVEPDEQYKLTSLSIQSNTLRHLWPSRFKPQAFPPFFDSFHDISELLVGLLHFNFSYFSLFWHFRPFHSVECEGFFFDTPIYRHPHC